ncbi:hypothetical protein BLNAU_20971 [Blattamonas nauphoetae]|uniref:Uncharacterized protein n=1 Tax=Blattamonas nauphoetae TaxID=2049346 RepID=A0ABQ9WYD1_9EUKA|nr:hypothetical protein BLNAU_20971 [Blattamonas nauphoetae]
MLYNKATFTQIEVNHAVSFLEYAIIHIKYREDHPTNFFETIFPEEAKCQTKVTSALIKLISHPSDKLRAVSVSFFDASLRYSTKAFSAAVASTGLLPQLFINLKPHAIPINRTTIEFHRHLTSIVNVCLSSITPDDILSHLKLYPYSSHDRQVTSEIIKPIFQQFCLYLRFLLAHPVHRTDFHSGPSFLWHMKVCRRHITQFLAPHSSPDIRRFFEDVRTNINEEKASWSDLATSSGVEHSWVQTFEDLLVRMGEGKQYSDLGFHAFLNFMSCWPHQVEPVFHPNSTFSITEDRKIVSSLVLPSQSLFALFVPTQAHHTTAIIKAFRRFMYHLSYGTAKERIWSGWFPAFFDAVNPSTLPFTNEFESLHSQLIKVMNDRIQNTSEYIIHLSLHPFALDA